MSDTPYRRRLGDFFPGQKFHHEPGKTVTEEDHLLFCRLTENRHPLHIDPEYAAKTQFGRIVAAGTYVLSLAVGLSVGDVSGAAIANLGFAQVEHLAPVFIGDSIYARSVILQVTPSRSKPDRGVITVQTEAYNQKGEVVLRFRRKVLIPI